MAIFQKAGVDELESYTERRFGISYADETRKNEMKPTEIRVTPGFNLPCDIIFAQSPNLAFYSDENIGMVHLLLYKTYENLLKFAKNHGYKNILLPSLGTGHYGFLHNNVAKDVVNILECYADAYDINIYLVLLDEETAKIYKQYMGMHKYRKELQTQLYKGIFWIRDPLMYGDGYSNLFFKIPVDKYGNIIDKEKLNLNSKDGCNYNHRLTWENLVKDKHGKDYNFHPRGRVEIGKHGRVKVYAHPIICKRARIKQKIIAEFNLFEENGVADIKFIEEYSEHYKCHFD